MLLYWHFTFLTPHVHDVVMGLLNYMIVCVYGKYHYFNCLPLCHWYKSENRIAYLNDVAAYALTCARYIRRMTSTWDYEMSLSTIS